MTKIKISIANPIIGNEEIEEVIKVLKSGFIAQGPKVAEFEGKFADYIGTKYAIATNSGTSALNVAILSCEIGKGDEVITTPFSFAATGNSILHSGARPVFVDIDSKTFNIDSNKIEEVISDKTKAILPVHLYGQSSNMDPIMKIAKKHDLFVIEDAAQAHGAKYYSKNVGSIGDLACFSFYPTKNMTTSEGGMITTNNKKFAEKAKILRSHGETERYKHSVLGYNFRMTDIAAAIGIAQLKKIDEFNNKRIYNANYLNKKLVDINEIITPKTMDGYKHVYHQYTIRVNGKRNKWISFFNEKGIGTGIHYPLPIYKQESYVNLGYNDNLEETEKASDTVISLPIHPSLNKKNLDTIVKAIKEASKKIH